MRILCLTRERLLFRLRRHQDGVSQTTSTETELATTGRKEA